MQFPESMNPSFAPQATGWCLMVGLPSMNTGLLMAIARLPVPISAAQPAGLAGVRVLDGGSRFNAHSVARAARGRPDILERITVSRAFTCYQVLSLLESTPATPATFVVIDILHTFYDESVQAGERERLLRACIAELARLGRAASGLVSMYLPAIASTTAFELLDLLHAAATLSTVFIEKEPAPAKQPRQARMGI